MIAEERKPFKLSRKNEFAEGEFDKILTYADQSRLFRVVLDSIYLQNMPKTLNEFNINFGTKQGFEQSTLIHAAKQSELVQEIAPLWSKAYHKRAKNEGRSVND